jgi:hypothetical protein
MKNIYSMILVLLTMGITQAQSPFQKGTTQRTENHRGIGILDRFSQVTPTHQAIHFLPGSVHSTRALAAEKQTMLKSGENTYQLDSMTFQSYDTLSHAWRNGVAMVYTYDSQGRNISYALYGEDRKTATFKHEYAYNAEGLLYIETTWYDGEPSSKSVYTYDNQGNNTLEIRYGWEEDLNDWLEASKNENQYDENNKLIVKEFFYGGGSPDSWMLSTRTEYVYDTENRILEEISYRLDYITQTMVYSLKDAYTYNAAGDLTSVVNSNWDEISSTWIPYEKAEYTYNNNHQSHTSTYYERDESTQSWTISNYEEYAFDEYGNIILEMGYYTNDSGEMVPGYKNEIAYDYSISISAMIFPLDFYTSEFVHMFVSSTFFEWENEQWVQDSRVLYHFSGGSSSLTKKFTDGEIHVYPNPVSEQVTIFTGGDVPNQVTLFNITGTEVVSKQFTHQTTLTVGNLPSGIYLIRITAPGKPAFMKKLVVQE